MPTPASRGPMVTTPRHATEDEDDTTHCDATRAWREVSEDRGAEALRPWKAGNAAVDCCCALGCATERVEKVAVTAEMDAAAAIAKSGMRFPRS